MGDPHLSSTLQTHRAFCKSTLLRIHLEKTCLTLCVGRYAHYGITDYSNYAAGLTSPLLADYTADAAGGLFAR